MAQFEIVSTYQDKEITLPQRSTGGSAGYDFYAIEPAVLPPQMTEAYVMPTGIKIQLADNQYLQMHIRSSLGIKHGIQLANITGIIDSDYYNNPENEGHIRIALVNRGDDWYHIKPGDRLAQGILTEYGLVQGDTYGEGNIRGGGIGSTNT